MGTMERVAIVVWSNLASLESMPTINFTYRINNFMLKKLGTSSNPSLSTFLVVTIVRSTINHTPLNYRCLNKKGSKVKLAYLSPKA